MAENKETRLFFVRHTMTEQTGTTLYGQAKGIHLSPLGIEQAEQTSQFLADLKIDVIFSSPLERAIQTAEIIAKPHSLDVSTKEELIEINTGTWTGLKLADCYEKEEWKLVQQHPSQFTFPQGESYLDVIKRMDEIITDIVSFNEGNNIVIVTHNGIISSTIARYIGLSLDNYNNIPCSLGSISEVVFKHGIGLVKSINVLPVQRLV